MIRLLETGTLRSGHLLYALHSLLKGALACQLICLEDQTTYKAFSKHKKQITAEGLSASEVLKISFSHGHILRWILNVWGFIHSAGGCYKPTVFL